MAAVKEEKKQSELKNEFKESKLSGKNTAPSIVDDQFPNVPERSKFEHDINKGKWKTQAEVKSDAMAWEELGFSQVIQELAK